ncbi:MAG: glycosyltransferase family 61 protein [Mucilaginibacter sp.]
MNNKKIKVALPVNATTDELHLFEPYLYYAPPLHKIKYIKSAFVTAKGLVCGRKGLIKECCHYDWAQQEVCFVQALHFFYDAQEDPKKLLTYDNDETYLLIHHPWYGNYYHWLCEALCRVWVVKDRCDQMILLLPPKYKLPKYVLDSLGLFNFKKIIHIPTGKSALLRTLCMPSQRPNLNCYNSEILFGIREMYLNYVYSKKIDININERIYVSRRNATQRKIVNEEEVITTLSRYNFTTIYNEDYSFFEQISIYSNAKHLASIHGAGLTNMIFMPAGAIVFELVKRKTNPIRHLNLLYWYLADALNHQYYYQICEPIDIDEMFISADIVVDIDLLNKNLELMFSK